MPPRMFANISPKILPEISSAFSIPILLLDFLQELLGQFLQQGLYGFPKMSSRTPSRTPQGIPPKVVLLGSHWECSIISSGNLIDNNKIWNRISELLCVDRLREKKKKEKMHKQTGCHWASCSLSQLSSCFCVWFPFRSRPGHTPLHRDVTHQFWQVLVLLFTIWT